MNRYVEQNDCLEIVNDVIKEVFLSPQDSKLSPCKTALNLSKVRYIAGRCLAVGGPSEAFDFLGYEFELKKILTRQQKQKTEFRYGITQAKIDKYTQKIEDIVKEYVLSPQKDIELLRHRIKAFTHRSVYQISRYKSIVWKNKGFIANYCELRFRMNSLTKATEDFLKNAVINAFTNQGVPIPYFLKGNRDESIYSLYNNMQNYRTLLFVELIGINHGTLKEMCRQIGIDSDYHKEILIRVEELLQYKVNQIGSKDPLLQKEFWYVITFINCPYISGSVKTALEGIVRPMATAAETNLANKIKKR